MTGVPSGGRSQAEALAAPEAAGQHPRELGVEILVDHYEDDWSSLWWVRLRGRAFVVDDGEELGRALEALAAKYPQYRVEPPPGPVVAVALDEWKWWHG